MSLFKFKTNVFSSPSVNIPNRQPNLSLAPQKTVWAIGGGKGGIGKTLLTSNMAVYLSWLNKKVVVVDMDLGGANLHTSLGVNHSQGSLSDFLSGKIENLDSLIQNTPVPNLFLISGAMDPLGAANIPHVQRARLLRKFKELNADFVLLDLGAGTSNNTIDFFLLADKKIIILTPEPTSIENAYRFIKTAFYRMLRASTPSPHVRQLIEQIMDQKNNRKLESPKDLLLEVKRLSPEEGAELECKMKEFSLSIILNQVRTETESELGESVRLVCERYFGMNVEYCGHVPYDTSVWQSVRKRIPFILDSPNSSAVTHLEGVLRNLIRKK